MSKKEKRTTPVDLPKEYRVVVMHFAKHKSYRVYCKNMALKGRRDHHSAARPHLLTFTKSGICILAGSRYRITYFGKGKIPLCLRRTGAILFRKNNTVLSAGRLGTRLYQSREQAWRNKTVSYHRTHIRAHLLTK